MRVQGTRRLLICWSQDVKQASTAYAKALGVEPAADAVFELPIAAGNAAGADQTAKKLSDVHASSRFADFFVAAGRNHLAGARFFQDNHMLGAQAVHSDDSNGSDAEEEAGAEHEDDEDEGDSDEAADGTGGDGEESADNIARDAAHGTDMQTDSDGESSQDDSETHSDDDCDNLDAPEPVAEARKRCRVLRKAQPAFDQLLRTFEVRRPPPMVLQVNGCPATIAPVVSAAMAHLDT